MASKASGLLQTQVSICFTNANSRASLAGWTPFGSPRLPCFLNFSLPLGLDVTCLSSPVSFFQSYL